MDVLFSFFGSYEFIIGLVIGFCVGMAIKRKPMYKMYKSEHEAFFAELDKKEKRIAKEEKKMKKRGHKKNAGDIAVNDGWNWDW